ncbi:MAG: hypothetical protein CMP47_15960 [Rickettsiales bacterium]|nr:hypothetical protein [Rickettsiales bacterium]
MPGQMPIGGGVDGPQYQDYGDVTDERQVAAASHYAQLDANLVKDTLVMDLAQYSGDVTPQRWNPEQPVLPPFQKLRMTGALQTTQSDLQAIEEEFVELLEQLSPGIRVALLKDMQLPDEERDPALIGLEKVLQTQAELNIWAGGYSTGANDKAPEQTGGDKGIFAIEDTGTTEETSNPIGVAPTRAEQDAALRERVSEYVSQQVANLENQVDALEGNFSDKLSLSAFLSQIGQVLLDSKEFLHLLAQAEFDLAQALGQSAMEGAQLLNRRISELGTLRRSANQAQNQASSGNQSQSPSSIQQAPQTPNAVGNTNQGGGGPVNYIQNQINQITSSIASLSMGISMALADLSRSISEISANIEQKLMENTETTDRTFRSLRETLISGLEQLHLKEDEVNKLSLMEMVSSLMAMQYITSEELLRINGFQPSSKLGISEDPVDQLDSQDQSEAVESTSDETVQTQRDAQSAAVQMSMGSTQAANMLERGVYTVLKGSSHSEEEIELIASTMRLVSLLTNLMMGGRALGTVDESSTELLNQTTRPTVNEAALELQHLVDNMNSDTPIAQLVADLRLHELPFEEGGVEELLESRRDVLANYGVDLDSLKQGLDSQANLAMELRGEHFAAQQAMRQVQPNVNITI